MKFKPEMFYHEQVDYEILWILDPKSPNIKKTDFNEFTFDKTKVSNIKECSIPSLLLTPRKYIKYNNQVLYTK